MEGSKKVIQKFWGIPLGRFLLGLIRRWEDGIKVEVEEMVIRIRVDESSRELYPVVGFGVRGVDPSGFTATVLV
jgi:hypothetical protein